MTTSSSIAVVPQKMSAMSAEPPGRNKKQVNRLLKILTFREYVKKINSKLTKEK